MSTPYNGGEETKMQTRHHKQTTLPDTSYEEIPLLSDFMDKDKKQTKFEKAKDLIRRRSPTVNFEKMCPIDFRKKRQRYLFPRRSFRGAENFFETSFKISWQESHSGLTSVQLPVEKRSQGYWLHVSQIKWLDCELPF